MVPQSAVIREWLGEPPYVFAASDPKRLHKPNSATWSSSTMLQLRRTPSGLWGSREFENLHMKASGSTEHLRSCIPMSKTIPELLRELVDNDRVERLFWLSGRPRIWSGFGLREWGRAIWIPVGPPSTRSGAAWGTKCMVDEQYNGLSTGNGKAAVVQLIRAFTDGGYPLEKEPWLRAFFAAGGEFRHTRINRQADLGDEEGNQAPSAATLPARDPLGLQACFRCISRSS